MFIYSLPLFFSLNLGSPLELLAIAGLLFIALYLSAPFPEEDEAEDRPFNYPLNFYFIYAWTAQLKLWRVFWPFFLLLNIGLFIADYQTKAGEISISSWDDVHFAFFSLSVLWTIAVWRSSMNTSKKIWAAYARLMTLAVFFEYGLKIVIRSHYANIFFECQEKMLDYVTCF